MPGSVSRALHLPGRFTGTFTSRYADTGDLRQHVTSGGDGPPLLLVHGWQQPGGHGACAGNQTVPMPDNPTQIHISGVAGMPLSATLAWHQIGG
jgi:pimeloyl-ACP methyl ester carboxylesterase